MAGVCFLDRYQISHAIHRSQYDFFMLVVSVDVCRITWPPILLTGELLAALEQGAQAIQVGTGGARLDVLDV